MKTGIIVQTRMGSTRLPGKVMLDLCGKPVIRHVIERLKQSRLADDIIIATTTSENDDIIVEQACKEGVKHFRGSEEDVLSRYYNAAKDNKLDAIVRVTSDCPLIDPIVLDNIVECYKNNDYDIVTNAGSDATKRTFPRGLDTEVFSFAVLEKAFKNACEKYQREHVTPFIYENSTKILYFLNTADYSKYRWTLDTSEDFELIQKIYLFLYKGVHNFYMRDILNIFELHPELAGINAHVEQKKLKD